MWPVTRMSIYVRMGALGCMDSEPWAVTGSMSGAGSISGFGSLVVRRCAVGMAVGVLCVRPGSE